MGPEWVLVVYSPFNIIYCSKVANQLSHCRISTHLASKLYKIHKGIQTQDDVKRLECECRSYIAGMNAHRISTRIAKHSTSLWWSFPKQTWDYGHMIGVHKISITKFQWLSHLKYESTCWSSHLVDVAGKFSFSIECLTEGFSTIS